MVCTFHTLSTEFAPAGETCKGRFERHQCTLIRKTKHCTLQNAGVCAGGKALPGEQVGVVKFQILNSHP